MIKDLLAGGVNGIHLSVMHLVRSHEANPGMVVVLVMQSKNRRQKLLASALVQIN